MMRTAARLTLIVASIATFAHAPFEWDYATWTKPAVDFAKTLQTIDWGKHKITARRVVLTGVASAKTKEGLTGLGIQLTEKALPGPLL